MREQGGCDGTRQCERSQYGWDGTGWDTWDGMAEMGYGELDGMRQDGME